MLENFINVEYAQTGASSKTDELGMRPMQARAYKARHSKLILLKAPPASGKSRALMYIALSKLHKGDVRKVIVSVPEKSIAGSFDSTNLVNGGFHSNWEVEPRFNLCLPSIETRKVQRALEFLNSDATILLCTHSTLRAAFEEVGAAGFEGCMIGIDEFHHASAIYENRLGNLVDKLVEHGSIHILAMTGSYFRGDRNPVLSPTNEAKFTKVTFNYYEQLDGYRYLKSLGIGFHFYNGRYTDALKEILDTDKKTILHIPRVNSGESTKNKYLEVSRILDTIGEIVSQDADSGIYTVRRESDGRLLKVADLVEDDPMSRAKTLGFLREVKRPDDLDLIIALNLAKEGFDWPFCEHALTVGYRGSLTEIVQIIGRCTRDSPGKFHAQFTNMIAAPDAEQTEVVEAANNLLKAIAASLLMEQVLAPRLDFSPRSSASEGEAPNQSDRFISIRGVRRPTTALSKQIIDNELDELTAAALQDQRVMRAGAGQTDPEVLNKVLIPKVIMTRYPNLTSEECEDVRTHLVSNLAVRSSRIEVKGNRKFISLSNKLINIEDIDIDLIDSINPFQEAFEVMSKALSPRVLRTIQECILAMRLEMTTEEALILWNQIPDFIRSTGGRKPSLDSLDPKERRLAEAIVYLRRLKRELRANS